MHLRGLLEKSAALSRFVDVVLLLSSAAGVLCAASNSGLTGRVIDPSGRPVPGAEIMVRNLATLVERTVTTNSEGIYEVLALAVGTYRMEVMARGFRLYIVEAIDADVARTVVQDVQPRNRRPVAGSYGQSHAPLIDGATTSVGHVIDGRTVQEMPLNGRYFLDLALLAPGSVTPSNGFSTTPIRGLGALAINTAGNREETVNYLVNGITLNDLAFSSIMFQPSISTVQEFKIDNSTFSAEYGQSSGAIVNVATRSGGNEFHGELFEFLRNDALDARNFFNFTSSEPPPFKRNQFGGNSGRPDHPKQNVLLRSLTKACARRRNSSLTVSFSAMPSARPPDRGDREAHRVDPTTELRRLFRDRRVSSDRRPRRSTTISGADISHILSENDRLHGYYSFNHEDQ